MTSQSAPSDEQQTRDAAYWARDAAPLQVGRAPTGALNLNVDGRWVMSPLQGFGQLWQKTFRIRLNGAQVTPAEVITTWKERFGTFWPKWDRFYPPLTGLAPGEVALINMLLPGDLPHGLPLSTGVLVLYADEESFTFMNPQGHMFAGWITFSASVEESCAVAQIQMLIRPGDLVYELGFRLGGSRSENTFWQLTLASLAAHFGVAEPVQTHVVCIDPRIQWSQFWNIWQNAAIRTFLYRVLTPVRWMLTYVSRGAWATGTRELAEPAVPAAQASGATAPQKKEATTCAGERYSSTFSATDISLVSTIRAQEIPAEKGNTACLPSPRRRSLRCLHR
jgi:hypothetical protein